MTEKQADLFARLVDGETWQSGGGIWLVLLRLNNDRLVVYSGDAICEYESEEAFEEGRASEVIELGDGEAWFLSDTKGNTYYRDNELELPWRFEEDARHEALALESRGEGRFMVRRASDSFL